MVHPTFCRQESIISGCSCHPRADNFTPTSIQISAMMMCMVLNIYIYISTYHFLSDYCTLLKLVTCPRCLWNLVHFSHVECIVMLHTILSCTCCEDEDILTIFHFVFRSNIPFRITACRELAQDFVACVWCRRNETTFVHHNEIHIKMVNSTLWDFHR